MLVNRLLPTIPVLLGLLVSSRVRAEELSKHECIEANESAQDLRQAGKLLEARTKLAFCAVANCPGPLREDCAQRLAEVDTAMPSLVFEAKDGSGNDLSAIRVTVDAQPLVERLDGTAIPVDPGVHTFVFETEGIAPTQKTLVVREGDKERRVGVVFGEVMTSAAHQSAARGTDEPPSTRRAIPPLAYVAAGIGVVGLAVAIGTGIAAGDKNTALKAECTPYPDCPSTAKGDLSSFHSLRDGSTVGYVVGAVGLLGGAALWLWLPPSRTARPAARLWIGPASAGVAGAF